MHAKSFFLTTIVLLGLALASPAGADYAVNSSADSGTGSLREAIGLANETVYGLSGSIWTRDLGRAIRVAKAIRTGVISVNSSHSVHTEAPFGGYKMSGIGREMGMHAVNLYTEVKNVFFSER